MVEMVQYLGYTAHPKDSLLQKWAKIAFSHAIIVMHMVWSLL
jgi:hypothetical protein